MTRLWAELRGLLVSSAASAPSPVYTEWASQAGHILLGLLTCGVAMRAGLHPVEAVAVTAAVWGLWEAAQVWRGRGWRLVRDGLVDLAHDACGVLWALALMAGWPLWPALGASVVALIWAGARVK